MYLKQKSGLTIKDSAIMFDIVIGNYNLCAIGLLSRASVDYFTFNFTFYRNCVLFIELLSKIRKTKASPCYLSYATQI